MTIQEYLNYLNRQPADLSNERECLRSLLMVLSAVSKATIHTHMQIFDRSRPFEEFVASQNEVLKECIELEMSNTGVVVREMCALPPLTLDTVV